MNAVETEVAGARKLKAPLSVSFRSFVGSFSPAASRRARLVSPQPPAACSSFCGASKRHITHFRDARHVLALQRMISREKAGERIGGDTR